MKSPALEARGGKAFEVDSKSNITESAPASTAKTFRIPISNGIFQHYHQIRDAIWLFEWYVDRTTAEVSDDAGGKLGIVRGGVPTRDTEIATVFGIDKKTICRWRNRLAKHGYIDQRITPFGTVVRVRKSKKWFADRGKNAPLTQPPGAQSASGGAEMPRSGARSGLAKKTEQTIQDKTEIRTSKDASRLRLIEETKKKLFAAFSDRYSGRPIFREAENTRLGELLESNSAIEVLECYRQFLRSGRDDEWLLKRRFPFGYFANRFEDFKDTWKDTWDDEPGVEADRPPDWEETQRKLAEENARKVKAAQSLTL